jgi:hypothetical protein
MNEEDPPFFRVKLLSGFIDGYANKPSPSYRVDLPMPARYRRDPVEWPEKEPNLRG